jgi:hypothetical protein
MSPRAIRRIVLVLFAGGIAGMIVSSLAESSGGAVTFGLVTAVAALGLILVSAVAPVQPSGGQRGGAVDEEAAAEVETRIRRLVSAGADERAVRELVQRAVELGRSGR